MKPNKNKNNDSSLKKLEYLSLVSKVCTELESHLGFTDKTLAEFITDLGRKCFTVDEFDKKLKKNGADLPDYFVRTLFNVIHAILPPKVKKTKSEVVCALNIGDSRDHVKSLERGANSENLENAENRDRDNERQSVNDNQVLVVFGKTAQTARYLAEARRLSAMSVAEK